MVNTLYCTKDLLEDILIYDEGFPQLARIIKYSNVVIDLSDEEFDELLLDDLFLEYNATLQTNRFTNVPRFFENLQEEALETYPMDIFIPELDETECLNLQRRHGVLVVPSSQVTSFSRSLFDHDVFDILKNQRCSDDTCSSWSYVLRDFTLTPFNCIIINDSYLINEKSALKINDSIHNIRSLIDKYMKSGFNGNLHISIFTEKGQTEVKKFRELINALKLIYEKRLESISLQVILHTNGDLHKRFVISGYHMLESDHGFLCFNETSKKAHYVNDLKYYGSYFNLDKGKPYLKTMELKLRLLKSELQQSLKLDTETNRVIFLGNSVFQNRLFSAVP